MKENLIKENIIRLKDRLLDFFSVGQVVGQSFIEEKDFFEQVQEAHREWQIALNNYNYCTDPDIIDYYICNIDAKEKKFVYLLKRARKEKIVLDLQIKEGNFVKGFDNQ